MNKKCFLIFFCFLFMLCSACSPQQSNPPSQDNNDLSISMVTIEDYEPDETKRVVWFTFVFTQEMFDYQTKTYGNLYLSNNLLTTEILLSTTNQDITGMYGIAYVNRGGGIYSFKVGENVYFSRIVDVGYHNIEFCLKHNDFHGEPKLLQTFSLEIDIK